MSRVRRPANWHGALLVNKPQGITSHDVVAKIRKSAGQKQVGHTGTLDPMATGLMIVLLGKATKLEPYLTGLDKSYSGIIELGRRTDTDDVTGETINIYSGAWPEQDEIKQALKKIQGAAEQVPPVFSAIKVDGVKSYKAARRGQVLDLKARPVIAYNIRIADYQPPLLNFRAEVSSGYYIRSLARDLGLALNMGGGALAALKRETVGGWALNEAVSLEEIEQLDKGGWQKSLIPPADLLPHFPAAVLNEVTKKQFVQGRFIEVDRLQNEIKNAGMLHKVLDEDGKLLGLGKFIQGSVGDFSQPLGPFLRPLRVLSPAE